VCTNFNFKYFNPERNSILTVRLVAPMKGVAIDSLSTWFSLFRGNKLPGLPSLMLLVLVSPVSRSFVNFLVGFGMPLYDGILQVLYLGLKG
jgi:hypothetical protein